MNKLIYWLWTIGLINLPHFDKKSRIEIYKQLKDFLSGVKPGSGYGFCMCLVILRKSMYNLPELMSFKPNAITRLYHRGYWFDNKDTKRRIKIVEKCIEMAEKSNV